MERFTDPEEAVALIEKSQEKTKMNNEAFVLCWVLVGKVKLHKYNQLKETKNIVELMIENNAGEILTYWVKKILTYWVNWYQHYCITKVQKLWTSMLLSILRIILICSFPIKFNVDRFTV